MAALVLPLALGLAATLLLLSAAAFATHKFLTRRNGKAAEAGDPEKSVEPEKKLDDVSSSPAVSMYEWAEIQQMTSGFSPAAVVGQGGFSTVYLARLSSDVTDPSAAALVADPSAAALVAVKVHHDSERLYHGFKRELDVLLRVRRHPNLVRLLGYSDQGERGALVFEYVPNGTLHEKLHLELESGATTLSWSHRMSIAGELADAIDCLHERCDLQIVHNDIKPSNVLVGSDLSCRLCDFGSAKMGFSSTVLPTPSPSSPRRRGTMVGSPGYVDPHYLRTGIVSKKSDVYSFGVVLLELVTGAAAFQDGTMLTAALGPAMGDRDRTAEIVDSRLEGEYDLGEAEVMVGLVARCIGVQPSMRPSMAEIRGVMNERISSSISAVDRKQ